jgi:hypothetical protein
MAQFRGKSGGNQGGQPRAASLEQRRAGLGFRIGTTEEPSIGLKAFVGVVVGGMGNLGGSIAAWVGRRRAGPSVSPTRAGGPGDPAQGAPDAAKRKLG